MVMEAVGSVPEAVGEGLGLILFSQMRTLPSAIAAMVLFALFTKMASGGTYAVVASNGRERS